MQTLHLSRCYFDNHRREVVQDLSNCESLHRRIMQVFPQHTPYGAGRTLDQVLYRIEEVNQRPALLVQSSHKADWEQLPAGYFLEEPHQIEITAAYENLTIGQELRFRLLANPSKRISEKNTDHAAMAGKRVELQREEDQLHWLQKKGQDHGFTLKTLDPHKQILAVEAQALTKISGYKKIGDRRSTITLGTVLFEGRLQITDLILFQNALIQGIGHGKAYGCGLLSIAKLSPHMWDEP